VSDDPNVHILKGFPLMYSKIIFTLTQIFLHILEMIISRFEDEVEQTFIVKDKPDNKEKVIKNRNTIND
jgi:hypothetical protein